LSTIRDVLQELLRLPGATYICVTDRMTGDLLAEVGSGTVDPAVVVEWGSAAAGFLAEASADDLDDVMITSRRSYHLLRQLGAGSPRPLLVYLCLDRARSNLAAARRELAAARLAERLTSAAVPAPLVRGVVLVPPQASPPAPEPSASTSPSITPGPGAPLDAAPRRPHGRPAVTPPHPAPPAPIPLPRRSAAVPAPRPTDDEHGERPVPPPELAQRWANDTGTMRRLLVALRALR
jgi:hypothetical protein